MTWPRDSDSIVKDAGWRIIEIKHKKAQQQYTLYRTRLCLHLISPGQGSHFVERVGDAVVNSLPALENFAFRSGHDTEHEFAILAF